MPAVTHRIVSLSPTATEMLYAIGAGDQVVAVDSLSTYPTEVADKVTKMSAYEPSVEAIIGYTPDVVLISNDMNKITEQLQSISSQKITVWTGAAAATLDDVYKQITELGALTGHDKDAATLIESMKSRIAKATENVSAPMSAQSYFYELDNTLYSVTSNTFVGALLKPFGLTNIADGVEVGNDYPQLNAEAIVKANPSVVFLADTKCCATNTAEVAKRPGWAGIDAVKNGHVVELDDDVASRWGPRVVDLVEQFAAAISAANK
jgi:iron complex transport system substrate-binding protein